MFDVDHFLKWLAVNTAIDNWDTYGAMAHNYYLYGDPRQKGRLQWIPWDNNMAFGINPMGGPPGRIGGPGRGSASGRRSGRSGARPPGRSRFVLVPTRPAPADPPPFMAAMMGGRDLLHRTAGERWPLMQKIMADEVYAARYRTLLAQALQGAFEYETFARRARQLHALVAPYVSGPQGERPTHTTLSSPGSIRASRGRARRTARVSCASVRRISERRWRNRPDVLLADEVRQIAVVLVADVFQQLVVGDQLELLGHRPRP